MRLVGGVLQLRVDDRGARYPVVVDPFLQQGPKLTGGTEEEEAQGLFGISVALSADGDTALIGVPEVGGGLRSDLGRNAGGALVFTRSGSTWSQDGPMLFPNPKEESYEDAFFGISVALSGSGYTALIGGSDDHEVGAAWVFTRTGSTWTQQGKKLTGAGAVGRAGFGSRLALSSDGNTALIGAPEDNDGVGAAFAFTRSGTTWTQDGEKLTPSDESGAGSFGEDVALSGDGDTALIGAGNDDKEAGAAWVFTRAGSTWTQDGEKLTNGSVGPHEQDTEFGNRVALSTDGDTALLGSRLVEQSPHELVLAAGWVFTRSGSTWTQQGPKLIGLQEPGDNPAFAARVALNADGSTALIASPSFNEDDGSVAVYTRAGTTWTQQGEALAGEEESRFGDAVALSAWGTALVGGEFDNRLRGAAWAYAHTEPGCTDSWTNSAGGSWFDGEDWSTGAPPTAAEEACIAAPGEYTVTLAQTSSTGPVSVRSLTVGGGASGIQTLSVASTCSASAVLSSGLGIVNRSNGVLVLTDGEACAGGVTLAGPVSNVGNLYVEVPHGGARTVAGNLTDNGTVSLAAGATLSVTGGYQQTPVGRLKTFIAGASDYRSLAVAHGALLAGTLVVEQVTPFKGSLGQSFSIVDGSHWLTGAFTSEAGAQIGYFPALYYRPGYSAHYAPEYVHRMTLEVAQASVTLAPSSGPPGTGVAIEGSGLVPGDALTPTFVDRAGAETTFPSVTVSSAGVFASEIAIPATAAEGEGTVFVRSSQTGVKVNRTFTVG
jgi:hypothetical protein